MGIQEVFYINTRERERERSKNENKLFLFRLSYHRIRVSMKATWRVR